MPLRLPGSYALAAWLSSESGCHILEQLRRGALRGRGAGRKARIVAPRAIHANPDPLAHLGWWTVASLQITLGMPPDFFARMKPHREVWLSAYRWSFVTEEDQKAGS